MVRSKDIEVDQRESARTGLRSIERTNTMPLPGPFSPNWPTQFVRPALQPILVSSFSLGLASDFSLPAGTCWT